jgi:Domain of unknown function (DUF4412)
MITMKQIAAIMVCVALCVGASSVARAGVVIDEQVTNSQANAPSVTQTRQLLVQGHKEKVISQHHVVIIDLDKGLMTLIDPNQKVFAQLPFPPRGMMAMYSGHPLDLNFKRTGKRAKVLGYSCDEYKGSGRTMMAAITSEGCFSASAPGAAEFSEFTKEMAKRLKAAKAMAGLMPGGIPLTMVSTRTMNSNFSVPGMPPAQAAKLKAMMAKQGPRITKTKVTKIATRKLSADTFETPAGYERRGAAPRPMPPHGAVAQPGAPSKGGPPIKLPE